MKSWMLLVMFVFLLAGVFAIPSTNVHFFYSVTCPHCENVIKSGVLENVSQIPNVLMERYEISSKENQDLFLKFANGFGIPQNKQGIPFVVIEQGGKYSYLEGDTPIIEQLNNSIQNFKPSEFNPSTTNHLTLGVIIVSALIDSINPCAFGVLIFLMAYLLSMGSPRRAFKFGIFYSLIIFVVYFLAGLGIMKILALFSDLTYIKVGIGAIILIAGIIEMKQFFFGDKGLALKIPVSAKPMLEKYVKKGTLVAVLILGALVALVELPCTGGIYLGILSMISQNSLGLIYLIIYNIIFILPLILITYFVYHGTKTDKINQWVQTNKGLMRLGAGIILILLALSLFGVF